MKSLRNFIAIILALISFSAFSQTYKPFRVGIGFGFTSANNGVSILPGTAFYVEPSYRLNDKVSLGLRMESNAKFDNNDIPILGSYTLNGQYYFYSDERFRFFAGVGAGIYRPNRGPLGSCTCANDPKINPVFGGYPRLGFDARHFVFTMEYNISPSIRMIERFDDFPPPNTPPTYYNNRTSYVSFKVGFFLGGGKNQIPHAK